MGDMKDGTMTLGELESLLINDGYYPVIGDAESSYRVFTKKDKDNPEGPTWVVTTAVVSTK